MAVTMNKKEMEVTKEEPKKKLNLKYMRDKDREMVKGKFIFHEVPGGMMSFVFRKYKEDPVERYDLKDGEIYNIPLGVAKHLNKNCWYPVHHFQQDEKGDKVQKIGQKVRRCSFQSLEFVDIEDLSPNGDLITVEEVVTGV